MLDPERAKHACPVHGGKPHRGCTGCLAYRRWKWAATADRRPKRPPRFIAPQPNHRKKVRDLLDQHLTTVEIGRLTGLRHQAVQELARPYGVKPKTVGVAALERLIHCSADDIPLAERVVVDATGTRRRLQLLAARDFSNTYVGKRLRYHQTTVTYWLTAKTVAGPVAATVKRLFESIPRDAVGPATSSRCSLRAAQKYHILPDRYWTDEQLDDSAYDPLTPVGQPIGVRRRLQALYREGKGPVFLGAMLQETPSTVASWTVDGPVPGYARHLVAAVYERWAGPARGADQIPHDRAAVDLAVREEWPSSLAWEDVDIDAPLRAAKETGPRASRKRTGVEQDLVQRAIAGDVRRSELTKDETVLVVQTLADRGLSARKIGLHLRWWSSDDLSDAAKSRAAKDAASAFVRREGIRLHGSSSSAYHEARGLLNAA